MSIVLLIDAAPDPVSIGIVLAVIFFVIAAVILIAGALVFFLWYRKRSRRSQEMIRPDDAPNQYPTHLNNPNQP